MRGRPSLGAYITGPAAVWVLRHVEADTDDAVRHFRSTGRGDIAEAIARAAADLREAARQWREVAASAGGSAEAPTAEAAAESSAVVDTAVAAGRLGVTERRVRQLLGGGSLAGEKIAGRWLVSRESITEYETRREMSA